MAFEQRRGRDRLSIIAEILEIAKEGTVKTQIMGRANLSFTNVNDYLNFLLGRRMLEKVSKKEKEIYTTTSTGIEFLQVYHELRDIMKKEEQHERVENQRKTRLTKSRVE